MSHPASNTMGNGSFLGVKWLMCGAYHPLHLVPRLKREWRYTSSHCVGLQGRLEGELYLLPTLFLILPHVTVQYKLTIKT
jgi:hypothetical protein